MQYSPQVLVPGGDLQQHQHHSLPPDNGAPASMPPSQPLHLTQLLGSEADQQVLLQQPNVHIISRAKMPRGDRLVSEQPSAHI